MSETKTLAAAMNEITDEDMAAATAADEGTEEAAGGEGGATETQETGTEAEEATEVEEAAAGEGEDDEDEEEEEEDVAGESLFEQLTPEQLIAIKKDPQLSVLYKQMSRAFTKKSMGVSEAIKLQEAFVKDPEGVLTALARLRGLELKRPGEATPGDKKAEESKLALATKKVEALFDKPGKESEGVGAKVRAILDEYIGAMLDEKTAPLSGTLAKVVNAGEMARMMNEEVAWQTRHQDELTPEIEAKVIALGEANKIQPGDMTPSEYLDTLLEIVTAREAKQTARTALARRIQKNRDDEEPTRGVGAKGGVKPASRVQPGMSLSEAFAAAEAELEAEG
jgi:hypothetical protein